MDKRDEIIELQYQLIDQLASRNFTNIYQDFWGYPPKPPQEDAAPSDEAPEQESAQASSSPAAPAGEEEIPKEKIEDLLAELDEYIGLEAIKDEVRDLINLIKINRLRREHDLPTPDLSLHMVFAGNPGTGKTMMARLMARVYHSLDILSKGHLVEVDRSGLVAGYVGQTALKTAEVIEKALGGVLFIDEAYALSPEHAENDYGREAIETILKAMEDHRDDLIVIVAGYSELMDHFINSNPGLKSRFNRYLFFEDYTEDEMVEIFKMRCAKSSYHLRDEEAEETLRERLRFERKSEDFGNARGVRNLFEKILVAQSNRLAESEEITKEMLMELTKEDIETA